MASKNWTKVETEKNSRGRWRPRSQVCQDKVKSLEAALGVWGPEDVGAKERIQEVLRRAMEGRQAVHVNPDIVKAEAVAKVEFWLKQVLCRFLLRSTLQCLVGDGFSTKICGSRDGAACWLAARQGFRVVPPRQASKPRDPNA